MSKDLNISRLCDAYGALLTDRRREIIRDYYDNDLSLAELAENLNITRQAALYSIKQAEQQLYDYEQKLGMLALTDRLDTALTAALTDLDSDVSAAKEKIQELINDLRY